MQQNVFIMLRDFPGIVEPAPDGVLESIASFLEFLFRIKGEGRVMPAAGLGQQAPQAGGPRIAGCLGGEQSQPAGLADPPLYLLQPVETCLLLAETREMLPPDGSAVLIGGPGVDEDLTVSRNGAASPGDE